MLSEDGLSYASEECFYRVHMLSLLYRNSPEFFFLLISINQSIIFSKQNYKNSDHYMNVLLVIITLMCLHLLSCRFRLLFPKSLMPAQHTKNRFTPQKGSSNLKKPACGRRQEATGELTCPNDVKTLKLLFLCRWAHHKEKPLCVRMGTCRERQERGNVVDSGRFVSNVYPLIERRERNRIVC